VFEWAMKYCMHEIQKAFEGIFDNFDVPVPGVAKLFKYTIGFWAKVNALGTLPEDRLGHKVAAAVQRPGAVRDSLTQGVIQFDDHPAASIEKAFALSDRAGAILNRIAEAVRSQKLPKKRPTALVPEALQAGVITPDEAKLLEEANTAREDAILVDSFALDEFEPHLLDVKRSEPKRAAAAGAKIG